ncbi:uncharacterized protein MYCGRDRAFT_39565 [Zymoseptoria tritici IPO323]|uniref:Haloacid dehalogenase n=1 Tax=Zymoseptoria tritici (strain CBS 115943 / IPO323) TaxID=336722 RepID=F9X5F0_ZYMTI|nr:uncharacterized protein MYCGRDRAFT_39565 [Zymoseptoria tritici IPO323]EGP88602.1 hypothetical protein MYCGRDRAFT_39565 [Zymoseptoria tritici IPO323]
MPPRPRNLLLCFDAFGTLFTPRHPIAQQYGDVARSLGLGPFTNDDIAKSFKAAFKQESQANPNYGKANGLDPEKWWANIITNTFQPLTPPNTPLPADLVPKLLRRFWCEEGYTLFPDVVPLVRKIRRLHAASGTHVVIGMVTNSDDRVPQILRSLGMSVGSWRFGDSSGKKVEEAVDVEYDVDFSVMSYHVGHEKPDKRIFEAAEGMLMQTLEARGVSDSPGHDAWRKVYVGDEYAKDVVGALGAGWKAVLIDRERGGEGQDVKPLDDAPVGDLYDVLDEHSALGFRSLEKLAEWLPKTH